MKRKHIWPISLMGHWQWFVRYVLIPVWQAKLRYPHVLKRIQDYPADHKLKVLFVVGTTSKWKCQSLYDLMANDAHYDPWICQTICDIEHTRLTHEERLAHLDKCRAFYAQRGMKYIEAYSRTTENTWIDFNAYNADLVFYNQPWDYVLAQQPHHVAKTALTFQMPYYVANYGNVSFDVHNTFQRTLFSYFTLNDQWKSIYEDNTSKFLFAGSFVPVGHTALDPYYLGHAKYESRGYVIYAPHWSIDCPGNKNGENFSTFLTTGKIILEFAKEHPEIKWIFKPHPTLRTVLHDTHVWDDETIDAYYKAWESVGAVCDSGGYERLFLESRAMITDCASFLTEYACTGNPIVHLISPTAKMKPMKPSANLYATYYQVHDTEELGRTLDTIVLKCQDPQRDERLLKVSEAGLLGNYAAKNIISYLEELQRGK